MQLPTSGPGTHAASATPYHGPPPNVMVSMGHILSPPNAPIMHAQTPQPQTPGPPHMGPPMGPPMPPHIMPPNEHMIRVNAHGPHGPQPGPHMFYGPPSQPNHPYPPMGPMGTPGFVGMETRIHDMNRRLQQNRPSQDNASDNDANFQWWNAFATDFFEDNAELKLVFKLEDAPHNYKIGRVLIPRYFRSMFAGGVKELYYVLRHPCHEFMLTPTCYKLECDNCLIVTRHDKPTIAEVHTEGKLTCIFTAEEINAPIRIREWFMEIRGHQEFIPRQTLVSNCVDGQLSDTLVKDITRQGLTSSTLKYLKLCAILEPMQSFMTLHKQHNCHPREALKVTLRERHEHIAQMNMMHHHRMPGPPQNMPQQIALPPEEPPRPPAKTRKRNRKSSSGGAQSKKKNASPAPQPPILPTASHVDVMVVSEPSLMGGEYGDEDERVISRLENTQYDPSAAQMMGPGGPQSRPPHMSHAMGPPIMHDGPPISAPFENWPGGPGVAFPGQGQGPPQGRATPVTPVTGSSRTGTPFTEGVNSGSPMQRGSNTPTINGRAIKTEEGVSSN